LLLAGADTSKAVTWVLKSCNAEERRGFGQHLFERRDRKGLQENKQKKTGKRIVEVMKAKPQSGFLGALRDTSANLRVQSLLTYQ
jgi:hypothetical protein